MRLNLWACAGALAVLSVPLSALASDLPEGPDPEEEFTPQEEELGPLRYDDPLPRGKSARRSPFLNLERTEFQPFVGAIAFSSEFEADPTLSAGLLLRVPTSLFDGRIGLWGEAAVSRIERDLPFYQPDKEGNFFLFGGGFDYEVAHGDVFFLRAQVGALYSYFNDVNQVENGFGAVAGLSFGWHWIRFTRNVYMTLNPQLAFDGEDWMLLLNVGMGFDF